MSSFFTNNIRQQIFNTPTMFNSANLSLYFFRHAPTFMNDDPRYVGITTVNDLLAMPGWVGMIPAVNFTTYSNVKEIGQSNYVRFARVPFTPLTTSEVRAVAVLIGSSVVFVTSAPFPSDPTIIRPQDGLTSPPDANPHFESPPPEGANRWLFAWSDPPTGATTITSIQEGPLALSQGAPDFETSHTQHVWLYPQRANMIANPSFEKPGMSYWGSNGTATRVPTATSIVGGGWAGNFTKASPPLIVESNIFPTHRAEQWTVQLLAKGNGQVRIGFVWWDDDFIDTAVDWGKESWQLSPTSYTHISICRSAVETYQGMLRIETDGTEITIDQVICEKGFLKDWPYFDGDTDYGARDDFSWYGGQVRQGASYSLWYNHERAVYGRLFAREIEDTTLITDEVLDKQGFVYKWVPAGTVVVPHIGVLHPEDLKLPVPVKNPTNIVAYKTSVDDHMGISSPWSLLVISSTHGHSVDSLPTDIQSASYHGITSEKIELTFALVTLTVASSVNKTTSNTIDLTGAAVGSKGTSHVIVTTHLVLTFS